MEVRSRLFFCQLEVKNFEMVGPDLLMNSPLHPMRFVAMMGFCGNSGPSPINEFLLVISWDVRAFIALELFRGKVLSED